jgi:hypothetical protein
MKGELLGDGDFDPVTGNLAETEWVYLGERLKEVWLPGEPATPDPVSSGR